MKSWGCHLSIDVKFMGTPPRNHSSLHQPRSTLSVHTTISVPYLSHPFASIDTCHQCPPLRSAAQSRAYAARPMINMTVLFHSPLHSPEVPSRVSIARPFHLDIYGEILVSLRSLSPRGSHTNIPLACPEIDNELATF